MKYITEILEFIDKYNYIFSDYTKTATIQPFTFIAQTNYYEINFMGETIWNSEDYGEFDSVEVLDRVDNIILDLKRFRKEI